MTFSIDTLGCKLNRYESDAIAASFIEAGFTPAPPGIPARFAIVNTCAVTGKSEQKSRRTTRLSAKHGSIVIVVGCAADVNGSIFEALSDRVVAIPTSKKSALLDFPAYLRSIESSNPETLFEKTYDFFMEIPTGQDRFRFVAPAGVGHTRVSLKIQDGCDRRCSYCITRIARGPAVSLPANEVIARLRALAALGHQEILLTGINISSYASGEVSSLWRLLERVFTETEGFRVRLSSLEPDSLLKAPRVLLEHPRLCPHFHLSIQSGSDAILAAMRRPYTSAATLEAAKILRLAKRSPYLSCDIIVGFPGESDRDFTDTVDLLVDMGVSDAHIFAFSARPGTEAASLPHKIPERIRDERCAALSAVVDRLKATYYESRIGQEESAIVESDEDERGRRCRTERYLDLWVDMAPSGVRAGDSVRVCVTSATRARFISR